MIKSVCENKIHVDVNVLNPAVDGSCIKNEFYIEERLKYTFLVDCGLYTRNAINDFSNTNFMFDASKINDVFITHDHNDHIGRLPLLVKKGFKGNIYIPKRLKGFFIISLFEAFELQKARCIYKNCNLLYTLEDTRNVLGHVRVLEEEKEYHINEKISVMLFATNHTVGSAMYLFNFKSPCEKEEINFLFTGDYNHESYLVPADKKYLKYLEGKKVNVVIDASNGAFTERCKPTFEKNLRNSLSDCKNVLIITKAREKSQRILKVISNMRANGEIDKQVGIYIDSKLIDKYNDEYVKILKSLNLSAEMFDMITEFDFNGYTRERLLSDGKQKIIITEDKSLKKYTYLLKNHSDFNIEYTRLENDDERKITANLNVTKTESKDFHMHSNAVYLTEFLKDIKLSSVILVHASYLARSKFSKYASKKLNHDVYCFKTEGNEYFYSIYPKGCRKIDKKCR